jgi:hypothetical protein
MSANNSLSRSDIIHWNGLVAASYSDGFCLAYQRGRKRSTFMSRINSRSRAIATRHQARFGRWRGALPSCCGRISCEKTGGESQDWQKPDGYEGKLIKGMESTVVLETKTGSVSKGFWHYAHRFGAIVGWLLSRFAKDRRATHLGLGEKAQRYPSPQISSFSKTKHAKSGRGIFSLALELFVAVAISLGQRYAKYSRSKLR